MKKLKFLPILFTLVICFTSCNKDDDGDNTDFDGSIDSIENFYTPELIDALDNLGFAINTGNTPPILNGVYLANPLILSDSNIANDNIGSTYNDLQMMFTNQNNDNLTLEFQGLENTTVIESVQSYVSGFEDNFSVFLKVESTRNNHTSILAYALSGTLTSEGILNYQFALIMLDDHDDPEDNLIENNTGRIFVDGNELCSVVSSASRAFFNVNSDILKSTSSL